MTYPFWIGFGLILAGVSVWVGTFLVWLWATFFNTRGM